jgi:hypothetical protein
VDVVVLVVLAAALLGGALVRRIRDPLLRGLTALAGAALVICGVVEAGPAFLGFPAQPGDLGGKPRRVGRSARAGLGWVHHATRRDAQLCAALRSGPRKAASCSRDSSAR